MVAPHSHVPDLEALQKVVEAFDEAPVKNPNAQCGPAEQLKCEAPASVSTSTSVRRCIRKLRRSRVKYVVPAAHAEGGDVIAEKKCNPSKPETTCAFPDYHGVVAWKSGFKAYRDRPINYRTEVDCLANERRPGVIPANPCQRRFSHESSSRVPLRPLRTRAWNTGATAPRPRREAPAVSATSLGATSSSRSASSSTNECPDCPPTTARR